MEQKVQLNTNRGLLKYILFSIITFSIYQWVMFTKISNELNTVCRDNKNTAQYWIVMLLSIITLAIPTLIWFNNASNRMGNELKRRGINYSISASTFWGWFILGALLFGIGPFVFIHKFLKASNMLNADFNAKGE